MKALHDVVILERREPKTKLYLGNHKECIGKVIAVGPGRYTKTHRKNTKEVFLPTTVQVGEYVMFSPNVGQDAEKEVDGKKITVIREADIMAVVDPDEVGYTENGNLDAERDCVAKINF